MEGLTAVQSRISEIQGRMASFGVGGRSAAWLSAASAAGLMGSTATAAAASSTAAAAGTTAETAVVEAATNYLGVPYLWGGTDPTKGLDCSGFTQRVYADLGITIPRTSSQQATAGTAVASLADARPGDLVFFDNSSARAGIDHVGIYLGNGKMIAAPQEGDVVKVQDVGTPTVIRRILPTTSTATAASSSASALAGVPYSDLFTAAAAKYGVSASVLAGMAKVESGFDSTAVSGAGAQGLMQFMPATAAGLGVNPLDPASAIDGAAKYLSQLTSRFGSTELGLAAYNAGPGAVASAGGIPPYPETQSYVRKVLAAAAGYA